MRIATIYLVLRCSEASSGTDGHFRAYFPFNVSFSNHYTNHTLAKIHCGVRLIQANKNNALIIFCHNSRRSLDK